MIDSHICPKCKELRPDTVFTTTAGKPSKWCDGCRQKHHVRMREYHVKRATENKARHQGTERAADPSSGGLHREPRRLTPLAKLMEASESMGAARQRALRQRSKRNWSLYYKAVAARDEALKAYQDQQRVCYTQGDGAACNFGGSDILTEVTYRVSCQKCLEFIARRDQSESAVSSK